MAAPITLNSTTLEGQLLELMTAFQVKERNSSSNPGGANKVTASTNLDQGTFTGNFSIDVEPTVAADGSLTISAIEYLDV